MSALHATRSGNPNGASVVLSHALGCDSSMYTELAAALAADFDVICFDHRGHGSSPKAPKTTAPTTIAQMADDAAAVITRECAGGPVHFVGTSLGGMVAQALAARHPLLLQSVVIANSAMVYDEAARGMWCARMQVVGEQGMSAIADSALQRWLSPAFHVQHPARAAQLRTVLLKSDVPSYLASCAAVMNVDCRETNPRVGCPALVIAGLMDEATPLAMSEAINASLRHAQLATLPVAQSTALKNSANSAAKACGASTAAR